MFLYKGRILYNNTIFIFYNEKKYNLERGEILKVDTKHGTDLASFLGVVQEVDAAAFDNLMSMQQTIAEYAEEEDEEITEKDIEKIASTESNIPLMHYNNHKNGETSFRKKTVKIEGKMINKASPDDVKQYDGNKKKEEEALEIFNEKIKEHKLSMKAIGTHFFLDEKKILFDFVADRRIDFRDLVRSLAAIFKKRIELHQIGVRDEARMIDGIFSCAQQLCCRRFLHVLNPVTIKMAKNQNAPLNTMKISGYCGRLLCCLAYENEYYETEKAKYPEEGSEVIYNGKQYVLFEINLMKQVIKLKEMHANIFEQYPLNDFKWKMVNGKVHVTN